MKHTCSHPELDSGSRCYQYGFTLLEIMVVIIIIAILAIVAVPQYKRAVLKSRYSALLPVAQHLKTAQEAYYTGNNYYSDDLRSLDLDVPGTITNATTTHYGEDMSAKISTNLDEEEEYSYVLASKEGLNNNYIMYQEHSKNYPGEVHCEAKNGDSYAQWLCEKGLAGQKIEQGSITPGYTTYVLSGTGNGTFLKKCIEEKELEDSSCACGKRTRATTGCDEKTGKWIYGGWSSCPVKPEEEKACSELGKGWTSGTATRTSQCEGGSWTEPEWDETGCTKECTGEAPTDKQLCQEEGKCGWETKGATCNYKTGEWIVDPEWNTDGCSSAPEVPTRNCHDQDSNTCGIQTQPYTCNAEGTWELGAWQGSCAPAETKECGSSYSNSTVEITRTATCKADGIWEYGEYDYTLCGCTMSTKPADVTSGCGETGKTGTKTYTYVCNSSNKWTSQLKSSSCTTVPAGGTYSGVGNTCNSYQTADGCKGYTFENRASCNAYAADGNACAGTFRSGSYCLAMVTGACSGATYEPGGYCLGTVRADTKPYQYHHCAAGTPAPGGKCWDGNGNTVTCS